MRSKNHLLLLAIFLFALGGPAKIGYTWPVYLSTTDPGTTKPPAAPWQTSITGLGSKLWIGVGNSYRQPKVKNITISIGATLTALNATASKSYGYYANGSKKSTVSGPFLASNNPRTYFISYKPQPDWEVLEVDIPVGSLPMADPPLADAGADVQVSANSHCAITTAQDVTLNISESAHEGPDDPIRITEIRIFPEAATIDTSVLPTFEGPEGSGTWQYEFTDLDPEGNVQENPGVRWYTDGPGIAAQEEYATTLTMTGFPGKWHSYFVFDDISGQWQRFRMLAEGRVPTLSEWGLIVMVLLLLAAGALVICRRRRVAA